MRTLLVGLLAIGSISAFAIDRVTELKQEMQNATPYEILKKAFDESNDTIQLQELDQAGWHCVSARAGQSNADLEEEKLYHFQSKKLIEPASSSAPSHGPLIPAVPAMPAKWKTKELVFDGFGGALSELEWDSFFEGYTSEITSRQITSTFYNDGNIGNMVNICGSFRTSVRKNGDLVTYSSGDSFSCEITSLTYHDSYGYCWKD